ncbi:MAG: hypothetical protein ACYSW6_06975, partial [Planctomycetota bacterium]
KRMFNPCDIILLPYITNCETERYVIINFDALSYVSIMTPICSSSQHLFHLIQPPIITIE